MDLEDTKNLIIAILILIIGLWMFFEMKKFAPFP